MSKDLTPRESNFLLADISVVSNMEITACDGATNESLLWS